MATVVIGDVHGCADELDALLVRLGGGHRLVFVGDLVDRGPDPVGVVARVRALGAACVLGNHDEKHLRFARHQNKAAAVANYKNPMSPFPPERAAQHAALAAAGAIAWFETLPTKLDLGGGAWALHGGAVPKIPLRKQKPAVLLRCRFVDDAGAMIGVPRERGATTGGGQGGGEAMPMRGGTRSIDDQPPGTVHWARRWPGPETLIYGHHVHGLEDVKRDRYAVGIDTGCVFGGRLTAVVVEDGVVGEVIQVPAKRAYAELREYQDEA